MYDRILRQMRDRIRTRQYVMTLHAEDEMDNDNLSIFDIGSGILPAKSSSGNEIGLSKSGNTWFGVKLSQVNGSSWLLASSDTQTNWLF